jgi:hypothetical protein
MQVELNYGRGKLPIQLPDDLQVTVLRKQPMPVLADPLAAVRKAFLEPVGNGSSGKVGARRAQRCDRNLRHYQAGAESFVPSSVDRNFASCRDSGPSHSGIGGDRPASAQPGGRVGRTDWRSMGVA